MPAVAFLHTEDPKEKIIAEAGNLDDVEVMHNQVLIGLYTRPENLKTAGGIILTYKTTDEDRYQTKVGVILKIGSGAFDPTSPWWKNHPGFDVGDWVTFRSVDGWTVTLVSHDKKTGKKSEQLCRLMGDEKITMRISSPDRIY